jgi:hypothetical protein
MSTPQPFPAHRDASTPCRELLEWLTDVPIASDGTDAARTQLRAYPRHTYSYDVVSPPVADKAPIAALRSAETFIVPLWCHAFERPALAPSAGIAAMSPQVMALDSISRGLLSNADAFTWPTGYYISAPAAIGRPVADARSITYINDAAQKSSVSFQLVDFKEVVGGYRGATSALVPTLEPFTGYWTQPVEQVTVNANSYDAGHLTLYDVRYVKRHFTLSLTFTNRAQILAFRRLLFALRGRLNPVKWAAPGEAESSWRLSADSVEISYLRPSLATCSLSLVQL